MSRGAALRVDDAIAAARDARVVAMSAINDVALALRADAERGGSPGGSSGAQEHDPRDETAGGGVASGLYQDIHGAGARGAAAGRGAAGGAARAEGDAALPIPSGDGGDDQRSGGGGSRDGGSSDGAPWAHGATGRESYAGRGGGGEAVLYDPAQSVAGLMIGGDGGGGADASYIVRGARETEAVRRRWRARTVQDIVAKNASASGGGRGAAGSGSEAVSLFPRGRAASPPAQARGRFPKPAARNKHVRELEVQQREQVAAARARRAASARHAASRAEAAGAPAAAAAAAEEEEEDGQEEEQQGGEEARVRLAVLAAERARCDALNEEAMAKLGALNADRARVDARLAAAAKQLAKMQEVCRDVMAVVSRRAAIHQPGPAPPALQPPPPALQPPPPTQVASEATSAGRGGDAGAVGAVVPEVPRAAQAGAVSSTASSPQRVPVSVSQAPPPPAPAAYAAIDELLSRLRKHTDDGEQAGAPAEARASGGSAASSPGKPGGGGAHGLHLGDRVRVIGREPGSDGAVAFPPGPTGFAPGEWVGVVLDVRDGGMCDGSVNGVVYFSCARGRGLFARPETIVVLSRAPPGAPPSGASEARGSPGAAAAAVPAAASSSARSEADALTRRIVAISAELESADAELASKARALRFSRVDESGGAYAVVRGDDWHSGAQRRRVFVSVCVFVRVCS